MEVISYQETARDPSERWTGANRLAEMTADFSDLESQIAESEFRRLAACWPRERGATSSVTAMATCPAYQEIIALGPPVVPYIFRQLESEGSEPQMWFWALKALHRGFEPFQDSDRGDFLAMALAWLNWGRVRYAW